MKDKKDILIENGTYNKNHNKVTEPKFLGDVFYDPMDIVQVKYEMLKEVEKRGATIAGASSVYGFSRTAFYNIKEAFNKHGVKGLISEKPGPRNPYKLTRENQDRIDNYIKENPGISAGEIAEIFSRDVGVHLSKRTVERYLSKKKQQ